MSVRNSVLLAILVLSSILCLVSCEKDVTPNDGDLVLLWNGQTDYSVVCASRASNELMSASIGISKRFYELSGSNLPIVTDISPVDKTGGKEIIVGDSGRTMPLNNISAPTNPNDFIISVRGESIYLLGGSDSATVKACEYFCENILSEDTFIPSDYHYIYEHRRIKLTVGGVNANGFYVDGNADSEILNDIRCAISDTSGKIVYNKKTDGTIEVVIGVDTALENNTVQLTSIDGVLHINASSESGLYQVANTLRREFDRYTALDFPNGYKLNFKYPIIAYDKLANGIVPFFSCKTDKDPLTYEVGEEMIFDISLNVDNGELVSAPYFRYTITSDFNSQTNSGMLDASTGKIQLKATAQAAGFVKIYVSAANESGIEIVNITPFNGGAGAGVAHIAQSYAEPEDFDEFWQSELAKLDAVEPVMTIINDLSDQYKGYKVYDVRIDCVGDPVSGYITMPENAEAGSLNILVGYTGYGVVAPLPSCRSDSIVFSVNAHSIDNGREVQYYNDLANGILNSYGFNYNENLSRDTTYFKNMILRDVQAVRYLMTLPEWNGNSISLNGGSQGAFQAIAVASLVHEVSYLYIANTWMCDLGSETRGRLSGWRPDFTNDLRYYDSVNFAKRIKCYTRIDGGLGDYVTPPSGIMAMCNNMSAPFLLNFIQGMTHYYTPPVTDIFNWTNH